jgi:AcrR family transcriptional regulator
MTGIRAKQKEETRDKVLDAARRLFVARNFDDVGVRDIAQAAGVATGTVIAAFGSKGDLLNAIIIDDFHAQKQLIEDEAKSVVGFRARMLAMMVACARYQESQLSIVRAGMSDSWVRSPDAEGRVREALTPLMTFLIAEVQAGQASGEVRRDVDALLLGQLILDLQLNTYRLALYDEVPMSELKPHLEVRLDLLLDGVAEQGRANVKVQAA